MQLKIITLNLRYDKPDLGNNAWNVRKKAVIDLILKHDPDIIGTQEGKPNQLLDLHRGLPEYQSLGCDRHNNGTGEHCAIFYKRQKFQCLEMGDFALSETPDMIGSITPSWENNHPRIVTYALLQVGYQKIWIFNTHLDFYSAKARELGAKLIINYLQKLDLSDSYLFVTGDFNTSAENLPRQTMLNELGNDRRLVDAIATLPLEKQMTYHDFTGSAFAAVDTIYYDSRVTLNQVFVSHHTLHDIHVSDHFPVIGEFIFNG